MRIAQALVGRICQWRTLWLNTGVQPFCLLKPVGLRVRWSLLCVGLGLGVMPLIRGAEILVILDQDLPQAAFAASEIESALLEKGHAVSLGKMGQADEKAAPVVISLVSTGDRVLESRPLPLNSADEPALQPEGFRIVKAPTASGQRVMVMGADAAGLMYGGLELAETIRVGDLDSIQPLTQNPYLALRGTKFNIPLDVRTPSYTDPCDAAQQNIAEMWNFDFWREYIDDLARYRYNYISLWSLHPFPSMVRVPEYPDVALDDVQRSTVKWKEVYSLSGVGFDAPEILENVEVLKKMSIDEKIEFWRRVMRYAKGRNVDFYVVTWNIFVNGTDGKYGITESIDNATTADYFRQSVRQMFLTYPDLAGVGLTTGENMPGSSAEAKEDWAFRTYGQGVLDAAKAQPGRKITLIHRQHMTGAKDIARRFQPLLEHPDVEFIFSFKYAQAHVFSSTTQPYHQGFVKDIGDLKTIWTLRNDDAFYFRWGSPDFVREFMLNIPYDVSRGYYFGSDQYVWGREFLSTEPERPREIEIAKHWYMWTLWGRLGYAPTLSNDRIRAVLQARYPEVSAVDLFDAWQNASLTYPDTTGFHWGALDFQWYIEACKSLPGPAQTKSGFHDLNRFITLPPNAGTDFLSIPDYVKQMAEGGSMEGTTPLELSERLLRQSGRALELVEAMAPVKNKELRLTLGDIETVAYLGQYYGRKIAAATELALYRSTELAVHQNLAILAANRAAEAWRKYASIALGQYTNPLWMNRVGYADWRRLFDEVLTDIEIAGGYPELRDMTPTPGGLVCEAEQARAAGGSVSQAIAGYTGDGYLELPATRDNAWVEWNYEAPSDGTYVLEVRYITDSGQHPAKLQINGGEISDLVLWTSGGESTWAWDRKPVGLQRGTNTIRLSPGAATRVDHLNVIPLG